MSEALRPFHVLNVHGWTRRGHPMQFAWLEEAGSVASMGFRTRVRGLRSRGGVTFGQTRSIQLRPAAPSERSISALIEAGWRAGSTLQAGILDGPRPDAIVCFDAGIETIAAAAMALPQADVVNARLLLHLRPDALILAVTPFGRQVFNRLAASFQKVGGGVVLILVRSPAQARLARALGLPAAMSPVPLPTALNTESVALIDRAAVDWPDLASAFERAGLGSLNADSIDETQVAAEAIAALAPLGTEMPDWARRASAGDWLEYLHSLGDLSSGTWLKHFNFNAQRVTVAAT